MIHASSALRSYLAEHTAGELKTWAGNRLRGVDVMPMVYNGKEVEYPHEAVAAALSIDGEPITPEKRAAIIEAMVEIRQSISTGFLRKAASPDQLELGKHWANVIDRARPVELAGEAESFLHACLYDRPQTQSILPYVAAAAASYGTDCVLTSHQLWAQLMDIPETAALAFRKLLSTTDFNEAAKLWIKLFENKLAGNWPTNMRLLTVTLIKKAPSLEEAVRVLSGLLKGQAFAEKAKEELSVSRNAEVQALVKKLQVAVRVKSMLEKRREKQWEMLREMLRARRKEIFTQQKTTQSAPMLEAPVKTMREPAPATSY